MQETSRKDSIDLNKADFGRDFIWGVSTAAYQIEGAHIKDGKGASIWDDFTTKPKNIFGGHHGEVACDFYYRYRDDILLMKSLNLQNFRFSISWSRILPNGYGEVNQAGIDFYNRIIDFCLECGITPWVTLYHWDLPQTLENKGGWTNRDILGWFGEYTTCCAKHFGDRVKHWMVLNEPMVFTGAGYFLGVHAPGRKGLKNFLPAIHHATLCQALGGKILRKEVRESVIGTTFSCSQITPYSNSKKDILAANRADVLFNRLFIEPILGLGYPTEDLKVLKRLEKHQQPDDLTAIVFDFDFIGIQNYTREVVRHSYGVPYLRAKIVEASERKVPTTEMRWEVYPPSIYQMIHKYNDYKNIKKIIITENGAAFNDELKNNFVHDKKRIEYLQTHLKQVLKAKKEGLEISGYFTWTFTDNFEWAEGYRPRFGLVYVDFPTQERIVKDSGIWLKEFLGSNVIV